jgi:hypothetical protein
MRYYGSFVCNFSNSSVATTNDIKSTNDKITLMDAFAKNYIIKWCTIVTINDKSSTKDWFGFTPF